jgi:hypothetical protein
VQSEVTVNANIGGVFEGGEVYFNGQRDSILQDKVSPRPVANTHLL